MFLCFLPTSPSFTFMEAIVYTCESCTFQPQMPLKNTTGRLNCDWDGRNMSHAWEAKDTKRVLLGWKGCGRTRGKKVTPVTWKWALRIWTEFSWLRLRHAYHVVFINIRTHTFFVCLFGSLFYDAFSVTRLYSVDDRVESESWWWIDEVNHPYLKRDSNPWSQRSRDQGLDLRPRGHRDWPRAISWR
jgi:hypothetical protein